VHGRASGGSGQGSAGRAGGTRLEGAEVAVAVHALNRMLELGHPISVRIA